MKINSFPYFHRLSVFSMTLFFLVFFHEDVLAQSGENKSKTEFWLDAGLGFSAAGGGPKTSGGGGLGGRVGLAVQMDRIALSARQTVNSGGKSSYEAFLGGKLRDEFYETALMLGYSQILKSGGRLIFSSGLSRVGGKRVVAHSGGFFGDGSLERFDPVFGVPFEIGIVAGNSRIIRFGIFLQGNFNKEENFFGLAFSVALGNFTR